LATVVIQMIQQVRSQYPDARFAEDLFSLG
jgi:hypothetical protein